MGGYSLGPHRFLNRQIYQIESKKPMNHKKIIANCKQHTRTLVLMDVNSAPMTAGQRTRAQDMGATWVFRTKCTLPKYVEKALVNAGFTSWKKLGHTSYFTWGIK